jgi:RNA polymerase sigma-70 factor (ECF subfamily)
MLRRRKNIRVEASLNDILDNQSEPFFDVTFAKPPNPEEIYVASELNVLIENQIRELPPRVQAAFRLRKIEEFSIREVVQALDIRETALKSRVLRARRKIARGLRRLLATPPRPHALYGSRAQPKLTQKFASLRQPKPHFERSPKT